MSFDNGSIKMAVIDNKGRALISAGPLQAGEIILKDSPILLYPAAPLGGAAAKYCSHCFRTIPPHSPTAVPCPNCSTSSLFCTPQCQSIALSSSHTAFVCQALIRLAAADSPLLSHGHDRHVLARFLVSAYNLAIASPSDFQALISLQGEPSVNEESAFLHSLISSVVPVSPNLTQLGFSVELTSALLVKDEINSFGLMEPFSPDNCERSVRGYGIYPRASLFNHDCLPNACRFEYVDSANACNTDVVIRVLHDVAAGSEICISYFPVNFKFPERQRRLKEGYGFTCVCDRCKVEATWSDAEEDEMDAEDDDDMDEDGMDAEDDDDGLENGAVQENGDDFPHAYFFLSYMCNGENCAGTLAPLPPSDARTSNIMSAIMECNVCGNLSKFEE